jgi:NNP family nitrate/nitrite transporter-like MFS transporter
MQNPPGNSERTTVTPNRVLFMSTAAFTICFAVWLFYGALIKYLTKAGLFELSASEVGVLIAAPILTGSVLRLPAGILTDRYGGRPVFVGTLLVSAVGLALVSLVQGFWGFLFAGLCFGTAGASFAVGVAFTAAWFSQEKQGLALGIFGAGNAGAGITLTCAPKALEWLTEGGKNPEGWRTLPLIYAAVVLVTAVLFYFLTENKVADARTHKTFAERMSPLKNVQVWRFGLYYFLVFGAFVGLSGWLLKYYVDVYGLGLATAGVLATCFSLPSGVIRAIGGYLSDKMGARAVMYWVLGTCFAGTAILSLPLGVVPFTAVVVLVGISMGIGKAAVYKHIPVYFPREVGVVGGMVGVIGGLGGFVCPLVFGWMLAGTRSAAHPTGLWTTAWMFLAVVSAVSLGWMHFAIRRIEHRRRVELADAVPAE